MMIELQHDAWHDHLYQKAMPYLCALEGSSVLLTGMTGFFGSAVLDLVVRHMSKSDKPATIYLLTRDSKSFRDRKPALADFGFLKVIEGDIQNFEIPARQIDYVIHGASTSNTDKFKGASALARFDTILNGARHLLKNSVRLGVKKVLFISSGAVYGGASGHEAPISESCNTAPDLYGDSESCYSEAKRAAELMHVLFSREYGIEITVARCFSFCGPHIPLDINYAIGNFIRDVLSNKSICILGDGSPVRSYMYTYDLAVWLLALLVRGGNREAYNVGSEECTSIKQLAERVKAAEGVDVAVNCGSVSASSGNHLTAAGNWYVPSIQKARNELGLDTWTSLDMTIRLTIEHARRTHDL